MTTPNFTTRHELRNGSRYPAVQISWTHDPSWGSGGYGGILSVWRSGADKDAQEHSVGIGQGTPLGSVSLSFDAHSHGAWEFASFAGVGVSERDLQWATLWAVAVLKSRRAVGDLPALP